LPETREKAFPYRKWHWVRYRNAIFLARFMKGRKVRAIWTPKAIQYHLPCWSQLEYAIQLRTGLMAGQASVQTLPGLLQLRQAPPQMPDHLELVVPAPGM
jgi:hypothetical protein